MTMKEPEVALGQIWSGEKSTLFYEPVFQVDALGTSMHAPQNTF